MFAALPHIVCQSQYATGEPLRHLGCAATVDGCEAFAQDINEAIDQSFERGGWAGVTVQEFGENELDSRKVGTLLGWVSAQGDQLGDFVSSNVPSNSD